MTGGAVHLEGVVSAVVEADRRLRPYLRETPLLPSPALGGPAGTPRLFLKCENLQHTGSFKLRGALNALLNLGGGARSRGVVAASTGNHGAAVAYASGLLGVDATIFVPETVSSAKLEAIRLLGAEVRLCGRDGIEAELQARSCAEESGLYYLSPYNDPAVVAGQGTVGVELHRQLPDLDAVFVALGGGGLISGMAAYLSNVRPDAHLIGCSPRNSAVMIESLRAGRILDLASEPTLSDGTAGGVEAGSITFDLCRHLVDDFEIVTEEEIAGALRDFVGSHQMLIEGAAAVAIAAYLRRRETLAGQRTVIVLCGANIALEDLRRVLCEDRV